MNSEKVYVLVWSEEDNETWFYYTEEEYNKLNLRKMFPEGWGEWFVTTENGIIIKDEYDKDREGKLFSHIYGEYFSNRDDKCRYVG